MRKIIIASFCAFLTLLHGCISPWVKYGFKTTSIKEPEIENLVKDILDYPEKLLDIEKNFPEFYYPDCVLYFYKLKMPNDDLVKFIRDKYNQEWSSTYFIKIPRDKKYLNEVLPKDCSYKLEESDVITYLCCKGRLYVQFEFIKINQKIYLYYVGQSSVGRVD